MTKITKTELKKKIREWLKRKGLSYTEYMSYIGGEKRYFDWELKFLRMMEEIKEGSIKRYFELLNGKNSTCHLGG